MAPGLGSRVAAAVRPDVKRIADDVGAALRANAPDGKTWLTAHDERVRPSHADTDGQEIPGNLRYQLPKMAYIRGHRAEGTARYITTTGYDLAREPGDPDLPIEQRINCFTGDTPVSATGMQASMCSVYTGPLVRVSTASGRVVTGTPNHPVLTDGGWIALGGLNVGDDLVVRTVRDLVAVRRLTVGGDPEVQHLPATFREVHAALSKAGLAARVSRVAVNFYGDRPAGDVEVVGADGVLADSREPGEGQMPQKVGFEAPDNAGAPGGLPLQFKAARLGASPGRVRRFSQALTFLCAGLRHAYPHRFRSPARFNSSSQERPADWPSADAVRSGKCLFALAREVATDEVVNVERLPHGSHEVYTLSTDIGIYIVAGGIVAANCRCSSVPLPGAIARKVRVEDPRVEGVRVTARVSITYPRVVESEHPDTGDSGGGWVRQSVQDVAAANRLR